MKSILLVGLGKFGTCVAKELSALKYEVLAVDKDENKVEDILPYVTQSQIGNAVDIDFLESLGVKDFDICFVCFENDFQTSLEATCYLKDLGAKKVISRAMSDIHAKFLLSNGADEIIFPEKQLAKWTAIRYSSNNIYDYIEIDKTHAIYEVNVPDTWIGKTVGQIDIRKKYSINIVAIKNNDGLNMIIGTDTILNQEDKLLVLGDNKSIQKIFHI